MVSYVLYIGCAMPTIADTVLQMRKRLEHECRSLVTARTEMAALADQYNRYVDLQAQVARHDARMRNLSAVLGPDGMLNAMYGDESDIVGNTVEILPSPAMLRQETPLWKMLREYLRFVKEARVGDMMIFLDAMRFSDVTRQAIESALKRHPKTFNVTRRGSEKVVSLKRGKT
jgi:hypothetical protein